MEKRGLGKGLSALLSSSMAEEDAASVREVRVEQIRPNPYQPRRSFDPQKQAELVQSIREQGILQPVLLRRIAVDSYELIAGERRFRAAAEAGLTVIPAIVRECTDTQMLELALIENIQREDISPVEAALAYQRLINEFGMTQQEVARRVGKAQPTIANTLRLLSLPPPVLDSLSRGEISEGHARSLLQVAPEARLSAWETVVRRRLTVRETERLAREMRDGLPDPLAAPPRTDAAHAKDPHYVAVEETLRAALGTKVSLKWSGEIGRIEIEFYSEEQLEGIMRRILGE